MSNNKDLPTEEKGYYYWENYQCIICEEIFQDEDDANECYKSHEESESKDE